MKKLETLFSSPVKKVTNLFQKEVEKKKFEMTSANGSLKYTTTGNVFVDEFGKLAKYREERDINDIFDTMRTLTSIDPMTALKLTLYMRLITRKPVFHKETLDTHRGQGLKFEYIHRIYYLLQDSRFHKWIAQNFDVLVAVGSWEDFFELMRVCLYYEGKKSKNCRTILGFVIKNLDDPTQVNLIKKYLPQIKPASKCKDNLYRQANNIIAKYIAYSISFPETKKDKVYAYYRRFKSSGNAHSWQQAISQEKYNEIDFDKVNGRALTALITPQKTTWKVNAYGTMHRVPGDQSSFLERHGLDKKYEDWISAKPIAKFTGYVYELFKNFPKTSYERFSLKSYQEKTINAQFNQLIETAKMKNPSNNFIVCVDVSGSMTSPATGTDVSAIQVAKSMALYFSYLLKGSFENTYLEFDDVVRIKEWRGKTPVEKMRNNTNNYYGSTDPLTVAQLLVKLRNSGYTEDEFPTGALLISDGEFNYAGRNITVFDRFLQILRAGGFSNEFVDNFKLVLWDIPNSFYGGHHSGFESFADRPNFFYLSGLDPAAIAFLMEEETKEKPAPKTAEELFKAAMNQELFSRLKTL